MPDGSADGLDAKSMLDFLVRGDAADVEDARLAAEAPLSERVSRGDVLQGLTVVKGRQGRGTALSRGRGFCRFRKGDRLVLTGSGGVLKARITAITASTIRLDVGVVPEGVWQAELIPGSNPSAIREALEQLSAARRGTGPYLLKAMTGAKPVALHRQGVDIERVRTDLGLSSEQEEALRAAARLPTVWGLQGPPGTGKSRIAVALAEACAGQGLRTLLVAHTHAAVNNVLAEHAGAAARHDWPRRRRIKIGPEEKAGVGIHAVPFMTRYPVARGRTPQPIVGATVAAAISCHLAGDLQADVVLVDEAGQVPLAHGACLGLLARSLLLFGDPAQLPPIHNEAVRGERHAVSILKAWDEHLKANIGSGIQALRETHRLNETLARLISDAWYPEVQLISSVAAAHRRLGWRAAGVVPSWVREAMDPAYPAVWVETGHRGRKGVSPEEAHVVADLVRAARAGLPPDARLAVLTPFRAQVAEIHGLIGELCVVDTVERLQGQSVDLAIISLTCSSPEYVAEIADFYFMDNRWNVALSRAKAKVLIVGSRHALEIRPASASAAAARSRLSELLTRARTVRLTGRRATVQSPG